jgi:hypothetical protein
MRGIPRLPTQNIFVAGARRVKAVAMDGKNDKTHRSYLFGLNAKYADVLDLKSV